MARDIRFPEKVVCAFRRGVFVAVEAILGPTEYRADFIREAVDREIKRREGSTEE